MTTVHQRYVINSSVSSRRLDSNCPALSPSGMIVPKDSYPQQRLRTYISQRSKGFQNSRIVLYTGIRQRIVTSPRGLPPVVNGRGLASQARLATRYRRYLAGLGSTYSFAGACSSSHFHSTSYLVTYKSPQPSVDNLDTPTKAHRRLNSTLASSCVPSSRTSTLSRSARLKQSESDRSTPTASQ